ncbi:hypothetical protein QJQ45_008552 [Haematococcus lacustris]|nr:hypothetical protein QJQ45_008552 [Haematococcus lacustris]
MDFLGTIGYIPVSPSDWCNAQPLSTTPLPPTPPVLSSLPPAPPLPPPAASNASALVKLQFTFFGLDLYSLVTWESSVEALVAAQPSSMTMQSLAAPGTCYSHLKALNTSALLNTSLTAQQLMPGLDLFVSDVGPVFGGTAVRACPKATLLP